jgi:hypothetical protein
MNTNYSQFGPIDSVLNEIHVDDSREAKAQRSASLAHHIAIDQHNIHLYRGDTSRAFDQEAEETREHNSQRLVNKRLRAVIKSAEVLRGRPLSIDPWNRITDPEVALAGGISPEVLAILQAEEGYTPDCGEDADYDKAMRTIDYLPRKLSKEEWKRHKQINENVLGLAHWQYDSRMPAKPEVIAEYVEDNARVTVLSPSTTRSQFAGDYLLDADKYREHLNTCAHRRVLSVMKQCGLVYADRPTKIKKTTRKPRRSRDQIRADLIAAGKTVR